MTERCKSNPCCGDYLNCKEPPQFLPREGYEAYQRRIGTAPREASMASEVKAYYELGNCLRGYFYGEFETDDEAWAVLSKRFNDAFPSRNGREVEMKKQVRAGLTAGGNETERDRHLREALARIKEATDGR